MEDNSFKELGTILEGLDESQDRLEKDAFDVINSSDTSLNMVRDSIGSVEEILKMISDMNEVVNDASEKINQLEQLSAQIEKFVTVISGIANKTNILSLNASIEAAGPVNREEDLRLWQARYVILQRSHLSHQER